MWFRNLQIFRLRSAPSWRDLQQALEQNALLPCGTDQALSIGTNTASPVKRLCACRQPANG